MQTTPGLVSSRLTWIEGGTRSKSVGLWSSAACTRNVGGPSKKDRTISKHVSSNTKLEGVPVVYPMLVYDLVYLHLV